MGNEARQVHVGVYVPFRKGEPGAPVVCEWAGEKSVWQEPDGVAMEWSYTEEGEEHAQDIVAADIALAAAVRAVCARWGDGPEHERWIS